MLGILSTEHVRGTAKWQSCPSPELQHNVNEIFDRQQRRLHDRQGHTLMQVQRGVLRGIPDLSQTRVEQASHIRVWMMQTPVRLWKRLAAAAVRRRI